MRRIIKSNSTHVVSDNLKRRNYVGAAIDLAVSSLSAKERTVTRAQPYWREVGDNLFAAAIIGCGGRLYRMVVELLPYGAGWDWTVWRPGESLDSTRYGAAPDKTTVIVAAESEVSRWIATGE